MKGLLCFNYGTGVGYLLLEEEGVKNEDIQLPSLTVPQYLFTAQRTEFFLFAPGHARFNVIEPGLG